MIKEIKYTDALEKLINEFENTPLNSEIEELKQKLNSMLNGHTCITRLMESHYAFRARINNGSQFFTKVKDLWYPPKEKIEKLGRLNRAYQPMFYISASQS